MSDPDEIISPYLRRIAAALRVPVETFFDDGAKDKLRDTNELLRLWQELRTGGGRAAALGALRKLVDDEDG